jgi:hypothetical protein
MESTGSRIFILNDTLTQHFLPNNNVDLKLFKNLNYRITAIILRGGYVNCD